MSFFSYIFLFSPFLKLSREWESNCCLSSREQCFINIMARTSCLLMRC